MMRRLDGRARSMEGFAQAIPPHSLPELGVEAAACKGSLLPPIYDQLTDVVYA